MLRVGVFFYLLQLVRCCPTIREFAPAGDLGQYIVVVVEGGGGEAGWGHRGGEADVAADQSELNILPSNHSSPAQLENGEVVVRVVEVWMVDALSYPNPLLPIRPDIVCKLFYRTASRMFQVRFKYVSVTPIMAIFDALNVEYLGTEV